MNLLHSLVDALEEFRALDTVAAPVAAVVGKALRPRLLRNALSGTALGHRLHPVMTDIPTGAWTMATLLDLVGGRDSEHSADLLVGVGIASAVPTALTGANDWADTIGKDSRVGLVHAVGNSTALTLYSLSAVARRRGNRTAGTLLGVGGCGALLFSAYLGGHLSYARGVNVNRTAWREGPAAWTPVLADGELADGARRVVEADGVSLLLYRDGGTIRAMDSVCSHLGGPLEEGEIAEGCVTCPWHGSTFRLEDGSVVRGPASNPQPVYEARVDDGMIAVRRAHEEQSISSS
ncbi:Rieske (2Fe-2S) protein [Arthrobacter sp. TMN-37]